MQASLDGTVKYAGHKVVNYKDGRTFVNLSAVDDKNEPLTFFCPGSCLPVVSNLRFGDDIGVVFQISEFQNRLNLRVVEIIAQC